MFARRVRCLLPGRVATALFLLADVATRAEPCPVAGDRLHSAQRERGVQRHVVLQPGEGAAVEHLAQVDVLDGRHVERDLVRVGLGLEY